MRYNEPLTSVLCAERHKTKTKTKPALSVVVPVFQEEKILKKHLSVFNESLRKKYKFELIVSDGGSTDKTLEIARKYADKVVEHNENRRQTISEGRNNGAYQAEGDTIVFINADTFPKNINDFFEIITHWNEKSKKYDAMACYVWAFPDEIILKDKIFYILHNSYVNLLNKIGIGMGRGECQIVRKKSFLAVGGYNDKIVAGEDFDLYRRLAQKGKINFSKNLIVYESPRRFRKYGYIKTVSYWMLNSLSVLFFGTSVSKEWEAVR